MNEAERVSLNVSAVNSCIHQAFPTHSVSMRKESSPSDYVFEVSDGKHSYKLRVAHPRLADANFTPDKIRQLFAAEQVAENMKACDGLEFSWGR